MSADVLKRIQADLKPAVEASMDAFGIVDSEGRLVFYNMAMKSFLARKGRELTKKPLLGELLKLPGEGSSHFKELVEKGTPVRVDESPASRGKEKLRVSLRGVPLRGAPAGGESKGPIVGALIVVRETTGEILLQAKYHKLLEILADKDSKIADLEERLKALRASLRKARIETIT